VFVVPIASWRKQSVLSSLCERRQRQDPVPIYLILSAGQAVCFALFFTIQLVYQVTFIGLNPLQMMLVGTVLEVTCFVFEVPTGVVADVYSRRLSILIGVVLMGCSYTLEGGISHFWAALVSQVFWGIGYTFTSGATQAWITDEIGEEAAGPIFLRAEQMGLIGGLAGTVLCMVLGVINIQLPMVLAGVGMFALVGVMTVVMPERHMHPTPPAERSTFGHMKATAREGLRLAMARPVARTIIVISLFIGLAAEAMDRLSTPSVIDRFAFPTLFGTNSPVLWFGISGIIAALLGLVAAELFQRLNPAALGEGAPARLLAALAAIAGAAVAVFALSGNLWLAFAMLWLRSVVGTISYPVQTAWLNRHLDSSTRATVISMTGQANSIGQAVGGPALGWVGNRFSIQAALLGSVLLLSPVVGLYARLITRERQSSEVALTPAD
jgi:DHA3 family tetracycline resistance protein-like MFS transporter